MFRSGLAYFLWAIGGFGALRLHRFYLRRPGTGILWLCTGGLGMVGAMFDLFYIPVMVRDENARLRYRDAFLDDRKVFGELPRGTTATPAKESIEKVILRTAKVKDGVVTPAEVALEGDFGMEEAKSYLEQLVNKGFVELRASRTGALVYVFEEFLTPQRRSELESL